VISMIPLTVDKCLERRSVGSIAGLPVKAARSLRRDPRASCCFFNSARPSVLIPRNQLLCCFCCRGVVDPGLPVGVCELRAV